MKINDLEKVKNLDLLTKWSNEYKEITRRRRAYMMDSIIRADIKLNDYIKRNNDRFYLRNNSSTL
jgi:hypothetical protein